MKNRYAIMIALMLYITGCSTVDGEYVVYNTRVFNPSLNSFASKLKGRRFKVESQKGFLLLKDVQKNREIPMAKNKDDSHDYSHDGTGFIYVASETKNKVTYNYRLRLDDKSDDLLLYIDMDSREYPSNSEFEYLDISNDDDLNNTKFQFAQIAGVKAPLSMICRLGKMN